MIKKIKNNLKIYKKDIKTKGIYWSIIHRVYKLPYARTLLTPLVNLLKPSFIITKGHKIFIDKNDTTVSQELILSRKWEDFTSEVFSKHIHPGDTVLDIGAHIGWFTLIAAKLVGDKGKVYAFEPDNINFNLLKKNVEANGYKNVVLVKKAVSNKTGVTRLFINTRNSGDHRIFDTNENRKSVSIKTISLDEYFENVPLQIDLIKMDIQGSEIRALRGAKKLLSKNNNLRVIAEFQPSYIHLSGERPEEFFSLLNMFEFKFYKINEIKRKLEKIKSVTNLLSQYPETEFSETAFTNILATK